MSATDEAIRLPVSLRDWFAGQAPEPTKDDIHTQLELDRFRNPHNDSYKPARRSVLEIECALRYKWADAMLAARNAKLEAAK
jgi:hypothetical protein